MGVKTENGCAHCGSLSAHYVAPDYACDHCGIALFTPAQHREMGFFAVLLQLCEMIAMMAWERLCSVGRMLGDGSGDAVGAHVLRDILSARNPMDRICAPQPELREVRGLPIPLSDGDYQIANAIDYAAWDAGLCEICHKQRHTDEPGMECECIGGTRALHRLMWRVDALCANSAATVNKVQIMTESDPATLERAQGVGE